MDDFSPDCVVFLSITSPVLQGALVHPSMSIPSSSEFVLLSSASASKCGDYLPWGFVLLRDVSRSYSLTSQRPTANFWFALSVSHALDDLLQRLPCRFISLCSHVQGLHFKGFPCRPADQALHLPVPSCRSTQRSFGRRSSLPVRQAPPSGLSSSRQSVVTKRLLHRVRNSFPSCASDSLGVSFAAIASAFTVTSARDLFVSAPPEGGTDALAFSVFSDSELSFLLLDSTPV